MLTGLALSLVAISYTSLGDALNRPLSAVSYRGARFLLDACGERYHADAAHLTLSRRLFSVQVNGLCSGLRGLAVWSAVVILLPLPWRRRLLHFAVGGLGLLALNVTRIAHLFLLGAGRSARFALFHEWLWPALVVGVILAYRLVMGTIHRREATSPGAVLRTAPEMCEHARR